MSHEQGWKQAREQLKAKSQKKSRLVRFAQWLWGTRTKEEIKKDLKTGLCLIALAHIVLFTGLAIFGTGCASVPLPAAKMAHHPAK